jgi:hypothetical protein
MFVAREPGLRFLCEAGEGGVRLNKREFSRYRWVQFPVPLNLDWIEGVKKILDAIGPELVSKPERKAPGYENRPILAPSRAVH